MMFDLGRHAEFIWLSYGSVGLVAGLLIVWLIVDGRRHARALAALEARGVRRRSAEPAPIDGAAGPVEPSAPRV